MFTEEEALGLALGLLAARRLGLAGAAPAVEGALAKLERVMPEALRGRVRALQDTVSVAVARPAKGARQQRGASDPRRRRGRGRRVRVRYRSERSGETERAVDPYGVMHREGYWYAAGHCHLRGGLRLFRVDRILEAEILEEGFERPAGLDSPRALLNAAADTPGDEWSVEVLLETAGRRPLAATVGGVRPGADGGRDAVAVSTSDLGWVARVLAGLECPFVVRRPAELRDALQRRAEEISALASARRGRHHPRKRQSSVEGVFSELRVNRSSEVRLLALSSKFASWKASRPPQPRRRRPAERPRRRADKTSWGPRYSPSGSLLRSLPRIGSWHPVAL